jgi:hypothetical protein
MAPLKVIKRQRACQYMASSMLDSVSYEDDFGGVSQHGHAFVESIE